MNFTKLTKNTVSALFILGFISSTAYAQNLNFKKESPINLNISNTDVNLSLKINENEQYQLEFLKLNGNYLTELEMLPLKDGSLVNTYITNSKIDFVEKQHYNEVNSPIYFNDRDLQCEALYVTYHLKGEKYPITQAFLINESGQLSSEMDINCDLPKREKRDQIGYLDGNYTIGFYWAKPALTITKPTAFTSIVSHEGKEIFPKNLEAYAFSKDFTNIFVFDSKQSHQGPTFGTKFTSYINIPNEYFFVLQFDELNKQHKFISISNVQ